MERNTTGITLMGQQYEIIEVAGKVGSTGMNPGMTFASYFNCMDDAQAYSHKLIEDGNELMFIKELNAGTPYSRGLRIMGDPTKKANVLVEGAWDIQEKLDEGYVMPYPSAQAAQSLQPLPIITNDMMPDEVRLHEDTPNVPSTNPDYGTVQAMTYPKDWTGPKGSTGYITDARQLYNIAAGAANRNGEQVMEINIAGAPTWTLVTDPRQYALDIAKKYNLKTN